MAWTFAPRVANWQFKHFKANIVVGSGKASRCASFVTNYQSIHIFTQNERDSVEHYKNYSKDEEEEQHRSLAIVPSIMRLTVLALFIALPAATYAAVCPQQNPIGSEFDCTPIGSKCDPDNNSCCNGLQCDLVPRVGYVCHIAHLF